jgi:cell wall-associated NlpC family hydrolase
MTKDARYVVIRNSEFTLRLLGPPLDIHVGDTLPLGPVDDGPDIVHVPGNPKPPAETFTGIADTIATLADPPTLLAPPTFFPLNRYATSFDAPSVEASRESVLLFRVQTLTAQVPARLRVHLNSALVLDTVIDTAEACTFHEVMPANLLLPTANVLSMTAHGAPQCTVGVSDIVLLYTATGLDGYITHTLANPARVEVRDATSTWLATFTQNARTVSLLGPLRTFSNSTGTVNVSHTVWVRLLPTPFANTVDSAWLDQALAANLAPGDVSWDVLAIAMQYVYGAPTLVNGFGGQIGGDASYGPYPSGDTSKPRQPGSDFNDYLGVIQYYDGVADDPEGTQKGCLDCSGFVRMVYGYRLGLPLTIDPVVGKLPRRAYQMADAALGIVTIPNMHVQATNLAALVAGDLVFFGGNAASDGGDSGGGTGADPIHHVGIYVGTEANGDYRFLSSRKSLDGPSLGNGASGGKSILNGTLELYATSFRMALRV